MYMIHVITGLRLHDNFNDKMSTRASSAQTYRQFCQRRNGGVGPVMNVTWVCLDFLTFGPHLKAQRVENE